MTDITQPPVGDAPTATQPAERDPLWFLGALTDIRVASELALPPVADRPPLRTPTTNQGG